MLDSYTLRARITPAVLAALPALVVLAAGALSPERAARIAGIFVGGIGLVVAGLVRDRGRNIQGRLWASAGGSPTVRRLRWRGAYAPQAVERLHARLNPLLDHPLPDADAEAADPADADRRYDEAIAVLRERTRDKSRFPLVLAENTEYGFRRNALGVRPVGIAVGFACLAVGAAVLSGLLRGRDDHLIEWIASVGTSAAALIFWLRLVTPEWVQRASEVYADRLLEGVESLRQEDRSAST